MISDRRNTVTSEFSVQAVDYLIVGAGISGLCAAHQLKQSGHRSLILLERNAEAGGTWLENCYPNSGCDVPSFLYSFSFAPKLDWTKKYARQPEILQYLRDCVQKLDLVQHIQFRTEVKSASYHEQEKRWHVETTDGRLFTANILISGVGQLNRPRIPDIPGKDTFSGQAWHSARWNHSVDLTGKKVAIVGNGASVIQFLPQTVAQAAQVTLFQRTPSWIHPLDNYEYPAWMRSLFRNIPLFAKLHRLWIFLTCEMRILAFWRLGPANHIYRWWLRRQMASQLPKSLHETLIPDYPPGCKRVLLSSDFLSLVQSPNLKLVTAPIDRIEADGVVAGGTKSPADVILWGTGFEATDLLKSFHISGRNGSSLQDLWSGHPKTLYGITTPGFPNFFMLYGPNSNLGHNSIIYMIESQVRYMMRCLDEMKRRGSREIDVKQDAVEAFDQRLQERLRNSIWAQGCSSWYKTADGTITNNWQGSALSYRFATRRPDFNQFNFR